MKFRSKVTTRCQHTLVSLQETWTGRRFDESDVDNMLLSVAGASSDTSIKP